VFTLDDPALAHTIDLPADTLMQATISPDGRARLGGRDMVLERTSAGGGRLIDRERTAVVALSPAPAAAPIA
jgi:hypothetical protein